MSPRALAAALSGVLALLVAAPALTAESKIEVV